MCAITRFSRPPTSSASRLIDVSSAAVRVAMIQPMRMTGDVALNRPALSRLATSCVSVSIAERGTTGLRGPWTVTR